MCHVNGSTNIRIDIRELVHPSHPDWVMAVAPYIAVSIDGGVFTRFQITGVGGTNIPIPDTETHLVWIVVDGMCQNSGGANRYSGWSGVWINSITTDGVMTKVDIQSRQVLFVGDSIVEGINTLGTTGTSESNSSVNEFSFKTALKLGSIPVMQGYGGTTVWQGINNEKYSIVDQSRDSFIVKNKIDMILIEYGYNDWTVITGGTKTVQDFINAYEELIALLTNKYSGVPIVCLIPFKQSLASTIKQIASNYKYCYVVETKDYKIVYADSAHPTSAGATEIANRLSYDMINIFTKNYFVR